MTDRIKRPDKLPSTTTKITCGCGNIYVTIGYQDSRPIEVFAVLGHSGGCPHASLEALTRLISVGLQYGVPVAQVVKQLAGIRCPQPNAVGPVLSCPDAIAQVIAREKEGEKGKVEQ